MAQTPDNDLDTSRIKDWRAIITLIVFVLTNIIVLFPFYVPIYVPRIASDAFLDALVKLRVIPPRKSASTDTTKASAFARYKLPLNFVTAPLIADLFLLAILAIGRKEVHDGTIGADHIAPYDIMLFFLSLAYIAISVDASGLIRYLAFRVLKWGGTKGHLLFFYLYTFFFALTSFIGNDPVILSGTAFLAYMTRVSSNIRHPQAWIFTQFAVANIGSAVLVSSNPTNLVLAGAFSIKFIHYTANIIVPVIVTVIVLFPFLLWVIFKDEKLIPSSIDIHELPAEARRKAPVNPNIPHAKGAAEDPDSNDEEGKLLSLEEIMNPFLDKGGAAFGAVIMAVTLITVLALNASSPKTGEHPVCWVTLPAAFVLLCWDIGFGWHDRRKTRAIAQKGREDIERARAERKAKAEEDERAIALAHASDKPRRRDWQESSQQEASSTTESEDIAAEDAQKPSLQEKAPSDAQAPEPAAKASNTANEKDPEVLLEDQNPRKGEPTTLASLSKDWYRWLHETFPTATTVISHLPFALVPFAFSMFVLVQALVTKGWVPVFAYGWDHWVRKTGTVGAVGGMGFLSVVLCNFAGTNIGTTILLSRIIQAWQAIHKQNGTTISNRTFWATVYSMALGVNYGAFSAAFSAALAGLLWRDILKRKHITVSALEFARVNLPIIAIAMSVGSVVLIAQVYIIRDNLPYDA